jgi:hypothetical protein
MTRRPRHSSHRSWNDIQPATIGLLAGAALLVGGVANQLLPKNRAPASRGTVALSTKVAPAPAPGKAARGPFAIIADALAGR